MRNLSVEELQLVSGGTEEEPDGDPGDGIDPSEVAETVVTHIGQDWAGNELYRYQYYGWAGNYLGEIDLPQPPSATLLP